MRKTITQIKEIEKATYKNKIALANHIHTLRMNAMKSDFITKTSLTSLRALVSSNKLTEKELKDLWKDGKKHFGIK